jgi:hypothetical protein
MVKYALFVLLILSNVRMSAQVGKDTANGMQIDLIDQHVTVFIVANHKLSDVATSGTNIEVVADCDKHRIRVSGVGSITYKAHKLKFSSAGIEYDGAALPAESTSFVITPDGRIQVGFVRNFDREPLR